MTKRFARRTRLSEDQITKLMALVRDSLVLMPDTLLLMDELRAKGYPLYCLSNLPVEHYDLLKKNTNFGINSKGLSSLEW